MKLRQFGQLILLIIFASLLSITALAQDESEAQSPLEVKLTTQTIAPCVGSPLKLELELTNNGQADVVISKAHLWKEFSYAYSAPEGKSRSGGRGWNTNAPQVKLTLQPGMSYRSTREFALDSNFFQEAGHYSLQIIIDHIYSNEVTFELYDCGRPQEVKEQ
ncbi:MAG TPA: hypothetical protein VGC91_01510 [Pyrinomonadaceae bacterium]